VRSLGKRVYRKVSRVRLPPSPPSLAEASYGGQSPQVYREGEKNMFKETFIINNKVVFMNNLGITKEQADKLVEEYIRDPVTKLHLLESEAVMRVVAKHLGEDEEEWGIVGLLHDIDWDLTKENQSQHCVKAVEILRNTDASDFLIETIQSHGYANEMISDLLNKKRETKIQHCLIAAETLTGIIVASALVQPDKKLASVKLKSLKKKFKDKSFAAKCDRELVRECEKAGISLEQFLEIGLTSLQGISEKLGM
jgi:uncharacterized protein